MGGWLSTETLGVVSWVGLIVTIIGFAATLWALIVALAQGRDALSTAQAAKEAITKLKNSISAVKTAYSSAQLETLSHLCSTSEHMAASVLFAPIKRGLILQTEQQQMSAKEIENLQRTLQAIEHQLALAIHKSDKFKPETLVKSINGIKDLSVKWELQIDQVTAGIPK